VQARLPGSRLQRLLTEGQEQLKKFVSRMHYAGRASVTFHATNIRSPGEPVLAILVLHNACTFGCSTHLSREDATAKRFRHRRIGSCPP